jgi:hypothetical protein
MIMNQGVSVCHLLKRGQDCEKLPLCPLFTILEVSHSKDSRKKMGNIFEKVFETRME